VPRDAVVTKLLAAYRRLARALGLTETAGDRSSRTVACRRCGRRNRIPAAAEGVPRCGNCHEVLPWIADAGDDDFTEVAERSSMPVLVDVWAPWCAHSWMVSPALERLATTRAGEIKLVKVEAVAAPRLSQRFAVRGIPTRLVLRGGEEVARQAGPALTPEVRSWLDGVLHREAVTMDLPRTKVEEKA
jgi:thioredoxin 2